MEFGVMWRMRRALKQLNLGYTQAPTMLITAYCIIYFLTTIYGLARGNKNSRTLEDIFISTHGFMSICCYPMR